MLKMFEKKRLIYWSSYMDPFQDSKKSENIWENYWLPVTQSPEWVHVIKFQFEIFQVLDFQNFEIE